MKKYILLITVITMGCSGEWYLRKALEKDPQILDTQYDSSTTVDIMYSDTTYHFTRQFKVLATSDTARVKDSITTGDTLTAVSQDSMAHAKVYYDSDGLLNLHAWALMDTLMTYQDSITRKNKTIQRKDRIIEEREATITEKTSFINQLKTWLIVILCVAGILLIVFFLRMFKGFGK